MAASQKKIADRLGISTPTVAISIKRMEKAGLVRKVIDESDLRRNKISHENLMAKGGFYSELYNSQFEKVS